MNTYPTAFNYVRAWEELALPAILRLPPAALATIGAVGSALRDRPQDSDTGMSWPAELDSAQADAALALSQWAESDPASLAHAAHAVNAFGHWMPGGATARLASLPPATGDLLRFALACRQYGAHWRFTRIADEELARVLGLPKPHAREGNGRSLRVIDGMLRVAYSSPDLWTWAEIGFAHPDTLARYRARDWPAGPPLSAQKGTRRRLDDACADATMARCAAFVEEGPEDARAWINAGKFYMTDNEALHIQTALYARGGVWFDTSDVREWLHDFGVTEPVAEGDAHARL